MATYIRGTEGIIEEIVKQRTQAEARRLAAENNRVARGAKRPTATEIRLEGEVGGLIALEGYLRNASVLTPAAYDRFIADMHARSQPAFSGAR